MDYPTITVLVAAFKSVQWHGIIEIVLG